MCSEQQIYKLVQKSKSQSVWRSGKISHRIQIGGSSLETSLRKAIIFSFTFYFISVVKALCNALRGRYKYGAWHEVNMPRGAAQW